MAQQFIDFGSFPNDPTADPLRAAFQKIQDNFTDIYNTTSSAGVSTLTVGAGLSQFGGTTGNILIISNIPTIQIQTTSSLLVGVGAATGNSATISTSTTPFVLGLASNITTANANFTGLTRTSNLQVANFVTSSLTPSANVTYDLGSANLRWRDLYLSGSTLYLGPQTIGANATSVNLSNIVVASNITVGNISASATITSNNSTVSNNITTSNISVSRFVGSSLRPQITEVYDLGNASYRWRSLTLTNTGITMGTQTITASSTGVILSGNTSLSNLVVTTNANLGNSATSNYFVGNAAYLSYIPSGNLTGQVANALIAGTVYSGLQPNITALGTLSSLIVNGNLDSLTNLNAANLKTDYVLGNLLPYGNETQDLGSATNRWKDLYLSGNTLRIGSTVISSNANITTISGGVITSSLEVGTVTAAYLGGTLSTASQPNITSVGLLSNLSVSGNLQTGELTVQGNLQAVNMILDGTLTAPTIIGNVVTPEGGNVTAPGNTSQLIFNSNGNTAAIPGVTFDTTASLLTIQGNVSGGNINSSGGLEVSGNANLGNISTSGISASGNVSSGNVISLGIISATGNLVGGNVVTNGFLSVIGNATVGNITTTRIDGTIVSVSGNISGANLVASGILSIQGSATVGNLISESNATIAGFLSATGNVAGGNITTNGVLSVNGNATVGNLNTSGNISAGNITSSGIFTATLFSGSGANLTAINGSNITGAVGTATNASTVTGSSQPSITSLGTLTGLTVSGAFSGSNVTSSGYVLTSVGSGIAAAGTTLAGATQLSKQINVIGTVSAGVSDGVRLPGATVGMQIIIVNTTASACYVYPQNGSTIDTLATNASFPLGAGARLMIIAASTTQWYTMVGVYG